MVNTYSMENTYYQQPPADMYTPIGPEGLDSGYGGDEMNPFDKDFDHDTIMEFDRPSLQQPVMHDRHEIMMQSQSNINSDRFSAVPISVRDTTGIYHGPTHHSNPSSSAMSSATSPLVKHRNPPPATHMRTKSMQDPTKKRPQLDRKIQSATQPSAMSSRPSIKRSNSDDATDYSNNGEGLAGRGRTKQRIPHTTVERRYRENLNLHLQKLRLSLPNLQSAQRKQLLSELDNSDDAPKPSKCEILIGAVDYISQLEAENARLKREMQDAASRQNP